MLIINININRRVRRTAFPHLVLFRRNNNMSAIDLFVRVFLQMIFDLLTDFIAEKLLQLGRCGLPLSVNGVDLAVRVFCPRHVPEMPAAIQQAISMSVKFNADRTRAEC